MGMLFWAVALILLIALLSKIKFPGKRVCPKCSQRILHGKCPGCGFIFSNDDIVEYENENDNDGD